MNVLVFVSLFMLATSSVVVEPEDQRSHKKRDHSDTEHFIKDKHNPQYDHQAFLGEDQAKTFDQLPPEESIRRLGLIVDRIDSDNDGFITIVELKDWIKYTQNRYIDEDVERQWKQHNPDNNESISWETYRQGVYGFMDDMLENEKFSYSSMLKRDKRRWHHADRDESGALNKTEFRAFLHPEEEPLMRDIIVLETIEDIDRDGDNKITIEEYIGDLFRPEEEGDEEPDWVKLERKHFTELRDANKDGHLDFEEVKMWIIPPDFDHAEAEARHLIYESDVSQDQKLTKSEILAKYDLFVGSQATDYGEALARHDEF